MKCIAGGREGRNAANEIPPLAAREQCGSHTRAHTHTHTHTHTNRHSCKGHASPSSGSKQQIAVMEYVTLLLASICGVTDKIKAFVACAFFSLKVKLESKLQGSLNSLYNAKPLVLSVFLKRYILLSWRHSFPHAQNPLKSILMHK